MGKKQGQAQRTKGNVQVRQDQTSYTQRLNF